MRKTPSKDHSDRLVSRVLHPCGLSGAEELSVDQAGPKVKVKTEAYKEVTKDATPSEQAVSQSLNAFASKTMSTDLFL